MSSGVLVGSRVVLRKKRLSDAVNDYAWRTDPELLKLDAASQLSLTFCEYLVAYADELRRNPGDQTRLAIETQDGEHIGNCMYYNVDDLNREAELGILIGVRKYWNKGYGTDAITTLINYIFHTTNIDRLYLRTLEWNVRARKCFEKCGFKEYDRTTQAGETFVVMQLFRREWLKSIMG